MQLSIKQSFKKIIFLSSIIFTLSDVYAASFDCNKASRTSETAICSNIELSKLDDELSAAYKNAVSASPDVKLSQRDWIKSSRLCENTPSSLDKCLKNAYIDRIGILKNILLSQAQSTEKAVVATIALPAKEVIGIIKTPESSVRQQSNVTSLDEKVSKTNNDKMPISSRVSGFEINEQKFCENFKAVDAFSQLAATIKRADIDSGIFSYFSYAGSMPNGLNWNPQALVKFTVTQLDAIYQQTPFTENEFENALAKAVTSCLVKLRQDKDYRFFVLNGVTDFRSKKGYPFNYWADKLEDIKKYKNLFDAYDNFEIALALQEKLRNEQIARNQPLVLGSDGTPVKPKLERADAQAVKSMNFLFNNQGVRFGSVEYKVPNFSGKPRGIIDWDKHDMIVVSKTVLVGTGNDSTSALGVELSIAALAVENGVKAISATYGPYLSSSLPAIQNRILADKKNQTDKIAAEDNKAAARKLVLIHPLRKDKVASCSLEIEQLKKTKLPASLDAAKLCGCTFDLTTLDLGWGVDRLDLLKSSSNKKEKDMTNEEMKTHQLFSITFRKAIDVCFKEHNER